MEEQLLADEGEDLVLRVAATVEETVAEDAEDVVGPAAAEARAKRKNGSQ